MPYSEPDDVRLLINTSLQDDQIGSLIQMADDDLDEMTEGVTLNAADKKACSMRLAAIMIAERQPLSYGVGEANIKMSDRRTGRWLSKVREIIKRNVGFIVHHSEEDEEDEELVEATRWWR